MDSCLQSKLLIEELRHGQLPSQADTIVHNIFLNKQTRVVKRDFNTLLVKDFWKVHNETKKANNNFMPKLPNSVLVLSCSSPILIHIHGHNPKSCF